jgi:hypothetical protein
MNRKTLFVLILHGIVVLAVAFVVAKYPPPATIKGQIGRAHV